MKLVAVRFSNKGWPTLEYRHVTGSRVLWRVPQRGRLTIIEANKVLGLTSIKLYRMAYRKRLTIRKVNGIGTVSVADVVRLKRQMAREAK